MSIFIDSHELATKKDIVNPNLLTRSKSCVMSTPAGQVAFGDFISLSSKNAGSIYLADNVKNPGIKDKGTAYFKIEKNTYYTQSLWITSSTKLNIAHVDNMNFQDNAFVGATTLNANVIDLGSYKYKLIGSFYSANLANFDISYIINFIGVLGLTTTTPIKISFDALKIEKGTISTDWVPNSNDIAWQSDIDELTKRIEALEKKVTNV